MEGFCLNMTCPLDWAHKPGALSTPCDEKDCDNTPTERCCAPVARCSSFTCPDRYVIKLNASEIGCKGLLCDHKDDRDQCCDAAMSCSQHVCPYGSVLNANHADL